MAKGNWLNRPTKKGCPHSITERRVPELIPVLGSHPAGDVSHKPGGRLPLLSAGPAVTPTTLKRAATNLIRPATALKLSIWPYKKKRLDSPALDAVRQWVVSEITVTDGLRSYLDYSNDDCHDAEDVKLAQKEALHLVQASLQQQQHACKMSN